MTDLQEQCKQFIADNGSEEVSKYLNVKKSTVESWDKTGNYPLKFIELMQEAKQEPEAPEVENKLMLEMVSVLGQISERLTKLESAGHRPQPKEAPGPAVVKRPELPEELPVNPLGEGFTNVGQLGGNKQYSNPAPVEGAQYGMPMSSLLEKKRKPGENMEIALSKLAEMLSQQVK